MSHLEYGSVVWVRLGQAWWPGTITTLAKCPPEFVDGLRKTPVSVVKFFHENEFQDVHKEEHIFPYSCERKMEFIRRGQYINKNQSHGDVDLLTKFESDVVTAEKLTGGDMNILATIVEVTDTPTNPCIPEPDLSPDPQSTRLERPRGWLPGEIVIGEPEGAIEMMRSPRSNNTQLVDLGEQDVQDDIDDYIEEEIEELPALPRDIMGVGNPQAGSYLPHSKFTDGRSHVGVVNEPDIRRQGNFGGDVRTDLSSSDFGEKKAQEISHSDALQYRLPKELSSVHKRTDVDLGVGEGQFTRADSDSDVLSCESRGMHGYSLGFVPQSPEVIEVESEPQSPEIVEEEIVPQCVEVMEEVMEPQYEEVVEEESVRQGSEVVETLEQSPMYVEEIGDSSDEEQKEVSECDTVVPCPQLDVTKVSESVFNSNHFGVFEDRVEIADDTVVAVASPVSEDTPVPGNVNGNHREEEEEVASSLPHIPKVIEEKYLSEALESNGECPEVSSHESVMLPDQEVELEGSDSSMNTVSEAEPVVIENRNGDKQIPMEDQSIACMNSLNELPDQSDSEQVVTSSGMDGDMDADNLEVMDDSCDSLGSDKHELDDSQEEQSEHELTINESFKSDAELSSVRADIKEADSSLSDSEKGQPEQVVSTSDTKSLEKDVAKGRPDKIKVKSRPDKDKASAGPNKDKASAVPNKGRARTGPDKDSAKAGLDKDKGKAAGRDKTTGSNKRSRERSTANRKRESSRMKNKKLKVELGESSFEISDDEELPDLLIASAKAGDKKLKVGDLVWVKYRKDWWPSYIKNAYPRDRKYSIVFVACDQNSGIRVGSKNVRKLYVWDVPSFVDENQEGFSSALHLCKLFHQLQEQGNEILTHDFFSRSPQAQVALLNQKKSPKSKGKGKSSQKKQKMKVGTEKIPFITPKKSIFDDPDFKSEMSSREKSKLQSALKVRKADNLKLVKFMKSRKCLEYLWKIYDEELPCERHTIYKKPEQRKSLLTTGIGPFHLDDGDEQILSVISVFREEILSKKPQLKDAGDYAFRVWIPEAIKEALRVVKKVPESELDEALNKGYRETAIEKRARKLSF